MHKRGGKIFCEVRGCRLLLCYLHADLSGTGMVGLGKRSKLWQVGFGCRAASSGTEARAGERCT